MIRVKQVSRPDYLSPEKVGELTRTFINSNKTKRVWSSEKIKEQLINSSNGKCVYCESNISEESKYMEVEHFKCKDLYPEDVVTWSNLLASCKRCNGIKSNHDVCSEPIINPYSDNPNKHLKLKIARFKAIDTLGKNTIDVLQLNDFQRLVRRRGILVLSLDDNLEELKIIANRFSQGQDPGDRRKLITKCKGLLSECQPSKEYSGIMATTLLHSTDFNEVKVVLEQNDFWDSELSELYQHCVNISFDICE
ncbi:hypothetical protein [Klebsiella sp. BIGb0407]|uniref:hypothetical protein n=1 Tax=Klebsiella sp. BIGb0407 TaxID=2940603 RepID=UPI00216A7A8B|nr:hypothetical protein [Klebsiella sp. BIGb0407]MCS3432906.1 uncharacterized protein (TIGR02646 family) [Klebsiella sp. BIGb0407]